MNKFELEAYWIIVISIGLLTVTGFLVQFFLNDAGILSFSLFMWFFAVPAVFTLKDHYQGSSNAQKEIEE